MDRVSWGYDFSCGKSVDAMLAVFNSAGGWHWRLGDSDTYGDYLKCQPKEGSRIRVYDARLYWMWRAGDPEGFWAELACDPADRDEIDRSFLEPLRGIDASDICKS